MAGSQTKKEFFKLFEAAWREAASVATAQSGFRESGTFPVNRNAIGPEVFEPSKTSDRPLNSASSTSAEAPNEPLSASAQALSVGLQRTRAVIDTRAFAETAVVIWNSLPAEFRLTSSIQIFTCVENRNFLH